MIIVYFKEEAKEEQDGGAPVLLGPPGKVDGARVKTEAARLNAVEDARAKTEGIARQKAVEDSRLNAVEEARLKTEESAR